MKTRVNISGTKPFLLMVALFLFICNGLSQNNFDKDLLLNDSLIGNEEIEMEMEMEMEASLENWMTDVEYFTEYSNLTNAFKIVNEEPIELELWMVDSTYFLHLENLLEESVEEEPEVEEWMINNTYWDRNKIDI